MLELSVYLKDGLSKKTKLLVYPKKEICLVTNFWGHGQEINCGFLDLPISVRICKEKRTSKKSGARNC